MDIEASDLIVGLLMAAFGLIGLFLASGAHDIGMSVFGYSLAGWALAFIFGLIRKHYDRADTAHEAVQEAILVAARVAVPAAGGGHE